MSGAIASLRIALGLETSGVTQGVAAANAAVGGLGKGIKGLSSAGSHFKGVMGGVAKSVGLVGLAGAGLAATEWLKGAITDAETLGATITRLAALTGSTTDAQIHQVGLLSAAMSHFGLDGAQQTKTIGMLQKNLGNLNAKAGAAAKFQAEWGFSVLDASGKVKDANTIVLDFADTWNNKSIPASKKAALAAKLFGKSYQDLIPLWAATRSGIQGIETDENALGNVLTAQQLADTQKLKADQRDFESTMKGLSVQVGMALLPIIDDLTKSATVFVHDNGPAIKAFLTNTIAFGRSLAGTITGFAKTALGFWNGLPGGIKDLLVKGFVADRAVKFLFGISITGAVQDAVGGGIKGIFSTLAGQFFGRGSVTNPMVVLPVGGGLAGAGEGVAAGAGASGLAALLGKGATTGIAGALGGGMLAMAASLAAVGLAVGAVALAVKTGIDYQGGVQTQTASVNDKMLTFLQGSPTAAQMDTQIAALQAVPDKLGIIERTLFNANASGVKDTWQQQMDVLQSVKAVLLMQPGRTGAEFSKVISGLESAGIPVTSSSITAALMQSDATAATIAGNVSDLSSQGKVIAVRASRDTRAIGTSVNRSITRLTKDQALATKMGWKRLAHDLHADTRALQKGLTAAGKGDTRGTKAAIQTLKTRLATAIAQGHTKEARILTGDIRTLQGTLAPPIKATATNTANTATALPGVSAGLQHAFGVIMGLFGQPHARGGWAAANSRILVGERHPEILTMGAQGGRIDGNPAASVANAASRSIAPGGGDVIHVHVGTLVANDAGLDELERRMESRRRHRTRGGLRLAGAS